MGIRDWLTSHRPVDTPDPLDVQYVIRADEKTYRRLYHELGKEHREMLTMFALVVKHYCYGEARITAEYLRAVPANLTVSVEFDERNDTHVIRVAR